MTFTAAALAQSDQHGSGPSPVDAINNALTTDAGTAHTPGGAGTVTPEPDNPDPNKKVAALRQQIEQLTRRFDTRAHRVEQRLTEQAERITQLEQQVAQLQARMQQATPPGGAGSEAASNAGQEQASAAEPSPESTDDSSSQSADSGTADTGEQHRTDTASSDCTSALADRFLFDVYFEASSEAELQAAKAKVRSINLKDWFALSDVKNLYVGRYGTCQQAQRRQADIHERTGLTLTIDAVAPDSGSGGDSSEGLGPAETPSDTVVAASSAPFRIVGVERRGRQTYLGVSNGIPRNPGDITWLLAGDSLSGWQLQSIRAAAGTATFAVGGRQVTVALPE